MKPLALICKVNVLAGVYHLNQTVNAFRTELSFFVIRRFEGPCFLFLLLKGFFLQVLTKFRAGDYLEMSIICLICIIYCVSCLVLASFSHNVVVSWWFISTDELCKQDQYTKYIDIKSSGTGLSLLGSQLYYIFHQNLILLRQQ